MRIDAHQHFWRYIPEEFDWIDQSMSCLKRDFLPADLKPELDRAGFDGTIAVQARQTMQETEWLLDLAATSPFILGAVGWVDLRADSLRPQLAQLAENSKLLGFRHIAQSEPDDRFLLQPKFLQGIGMLAEFGLTYDILIHARQLSVAAELVSPFPRQRFVLDHLANPLIEDRTLQPWENDIKKVGVLPECRLQVIGTGDRGGLEGLGTRAPYALSELFRS